MLTFRAQFTLSPPPNRLLYLPRHMQGSMFPLPRVCLYFHDITKKLNSTPFFILSSIVGVYYCIVKKRSSGHFHTSSTNDLWEITCNLWETNTDLSATEYIFPSLFGGSVVQAACLPSQKQSFTNLIPNIFPASSFHFLFQTASVRIRQGKRTHTSQLHGEKFNTENKRQLCEKSRDQRERRSNLQLRNCKKLLPPLGLTNKDRM